MLVLRATLVVLDSQQYSDLLGIGESLCFDWTVREQEGHQATHDDGEQSYRQKEDAPACKCLAVAERYSIRNSTSNNLREGIAEVKISGRSIRKAPVV